MKKPFALALTALVAVSAYCADATAPRSVAEISARWEKYRPVFKDWRIMETAADFNEPFVVGSLKAGYARDGLNMLNFLRFLAGMPDDVELDPDLAHKAQALTAVNAMNGVQSHTPARPEGVPKEIYDSAYPAGAKSNLQMSFTEGSFSAREAAEGADRWGPYPKLGQFRRYYLARAVLDFFCDADYRNVRKAEHRRNLFRPQAKKTGFGVVDFYRERRFTEEDKKTTTMDPNYFEAGGAWFKFNLDQFNSMYAADSGRSPAPSYDYLAWPAAGYFPLEFWSYAGADHPWSVNLNPAKYRVDDPAALKVEIAGPNGYLVRLGKEDRPENWDAIGDDDMDPGDKLKKFLRYSPATANWTPFILFFPGEAKWPEPKAGDRYRVTIRGVKNVSGGNEAIEYWTEFFPLPGTAWLENSYAED